MRGVVDKESAVRVRCIVDAQQDELRIDRSIGNALQVIEQRAGAAVLAEQQPVVPKQDPLPTPSRAGNIDCDASWTAPKILRSSSADTPSRRRLSEALPKGRNAGAECVCDAASSSTGIPSFDATSRRRFSETILPRSMVTIAIRDSPASSTSTFAKSGSCVPFAGPHWRFA